MQAGRESGSVARECLAMPVDLSPGFGIYLVTALCQEIQNERNAIGEKLRAKIEDVLRLNSYL